MEDFVFLKTNALVPLITCRVQMRRLVKPKRPPKERSEHSLSETLRASSWGSLVFSNDSSILLRADKITIGRGSKNTIVVKGRFVSSRHCVILHVPGVGPVISDIRSPAPVLDYFLMSASGCGFLVVTVQTAHR